MALDPVVDVTSEIGAGPRLEGELVSPELARPRIGLLSNAGIGNFGNDASLMAVAQMLRRLFPGAEVVSISARPEVVRARLGLESENVFSPRPELGNLPRGVRRAILAASRAADLARAHRVVGEFDAVVVPGTGILDDFGGERMYSWPYGVLSWFAAARARGVPTALLSIGAGPISSTLGRRMAGWIGHLSTYQSYRDDTSQAFMIGQGVASAKTRLAPDVVFGLDVAAIHALRSVQPPDAPVAVIAVMDYAGWLPQNTEASGIRARYLADLTAASLWLHNRGYRVRLMTADENGDAKALEELASAVRSALSDSEAGGISVLVAKDLLDVMRHMADSSLVVATRYHSVVAALLTGVPVISLGYATKNEDLLRRVGLADFAMDAERIDHARFRQMVERFEAEHDQISSTLRREVAQMRSDLEDEQELAVATLLTTPRGRFRRRGEGRRAGTPRTATWPSAPPATADVDGADADGDATR